MHVVIHHKIKDPKAFWNIVAKSGDTQPPAGMKLVAFYPSADDTAAFCVYEADSLEALRSYVDAGLGNTSENSFYPVKVEAAMGLPA